MCLDNKIVIQFFFYHVKAMPYSILHLYCVLPICIQYYAEICILKGNAFIKLLKINMICN